MVQQKMKAITFLFGCSSTKLISQGLNSKMLGSHSNFHAAACPALVGALWIVTDFHTDYMATYLLSTWLNSPAKNSWASVDLKKWKIGEMGECVCQ
jgi:separase